MKDTENRDDKPGDKGDNNDASNSNKKEQQLTIRHIDPDEPLAYFRFEQSSLKDVVEDLPDGYYEANLRGNLIAFNRTLCRIHGYTPEEMLHKSFREFCPPELHETVFNAFASVYSTGQPLQVLDFPVKRLDGSLALIHTSVHLIRNKEGEPTGFRGISKDVTEQKRNEIYEKERTQVLESIAKNEPLDGLTEAILASLQAQMPDFAGIFFKIQDGFLQCTAAVNIPDEFKSLVNGEKISPDGSVCARAAFLSEPVVSENVETDNRCKGYRDVLLTYGIRAVWAYPVTTEKSGLLGVLAAYTLSARAPLGREKEWLQSAVATAGIALEHHYMTSELAYLSRHDNLTGILNRRSFMSESERLLALAYRKGWSPAILFLDLDRFKEINDTWGHKIGDLLLAETATRLSDCLRQSDCLARIGGDEFAVFVPESGTDSAQVVASRILQTMAEPFELEGVILSVGVSIGISLCAAGKKTSIDTMLTQADEAMYKAKSNGMGWAFHSPEDQRTARKEAKMESMLRRSMASGDLPVYYQPVRDLKTGRWVGAEALVRWRHPERGIIRAAEFLPVAESRSLIREIDRYVIPRALEETRDWHGWLSVNVSPVSMCQPDWASFVHDCLEAHAFPPERLILEVTERVLLDMERVHGVLEALCQMGVRIALDDFGSGYSSLSYLSQFSVHYLKMDQGFIRDLNTNLRNTTLVRMLLGLTENLGLVSVAEGVETSTDLEWLVKNDCNMAQGFFLAHPAAWNDLDLKVKTKPDKNG